jgi:SAM-dependent methyltransferase
LKSPVSYRKISCPNCQSDHYTCFIQGTVLDTYRFYAKLEGFDKLDYVRCKSCGLIYSNPRLTYTDTTLNDLFPEHVEKRRKEHSNKEKELLAKKTAMVNKVAELLEGRCGKFLEIGCGPGYALAAAKACGFEVIGTELFQGFIEICQKKGFDVIPGKINVVSFPSESFDVVFLDDVLEHLDDPFKYMDEIVRVTKPGGIAFIHTWVIDEPTTVQAAFGKDWRSDMNLDLTAHTTIFPTQLLLDQLSRRGLIPIPEETSCWAPDSDSRINAIKFCDFYTRKMIS